MVLVDGSPECNRILREACRLAEAKRAPWLAVHLDVTQRLIHPRAEERRLVANLNLVERLGGDLVRIQPSRRAVARDLLALAKARRVTHLVLGRAGSRWATGSRPSLLEDLAQGDLELVIHVVPRSEAPAPPPPPPEKESLDLGKAGLAALFVALATAIGFPVYDYLGQVDVIMLYMLVIIVAATHLGRSATLVASVLSILSLDFCFIDPRYSFVLTDLKHLGTFAVMLGIGWVILGLTQRIRAQTRLAQGQERQTRILYRLSKALAEGGSSPAIHRRVEAYLRQELDVPVAVLLCDEKGQLRDQLVRDLRLAPEELEIARTAMERGVPVGHGTEAFPQARCLMLPMMGAERALGVVAILLVPVTAFLQSARLDLLIPMVSQISLALERARLSEERTESRIRAEHERLHNTLLSSLSHDLRTPLGTITGATSSLLNPGPQSAPGDQQVLLTTIHQESSRLLRMINNLLGITKLESGMVRVKKEWAAIEEVVGSALSHLKEQLGTRPVSVELPEIWIPMDPVLIEQALINILDNAIKFSPPGSAIEVRGWVEDKQFRISVADEGPGVPAGEEELIFDKLYRGTGRPPAPGAGLGLAICRGIAQAHGGTIMAQNRPGGGARIILTLPRESSTEEAMPSELDPEFIP
jgi:two-component system sensor histidine kinase KdpD